MGDCTDVHRNRLGFLLFKTLDGGRQLILTCCEVIELIVPCGICLDTSGLVLCDIEQCDLRYGNNSTRRIEDRACERAALRVGDAASMLPSW